MKILQSLLFSLLAATNIFAEGPKAIVLDPGHEPWNKKMENTKSGESYANLIFSKTLEKIIDEHEKYDAISTLTEYGYDQILNDFEKKYRYVVHARRKYSGNKPKKGPVDRYYQMLYSRGLFFHKKFLKEKFDPKAFVSFHYNAPGDEKDYHGFCVYYSTKGKYAAQSKELAMLLKTALVSNGYQTSTNGGEKKGYAEGNFAVLRMASMEVPAVLIELGYITNKQDKEEANDLKKIDAKAEIIYAVLEDFLSRRK